MTKISNFALKIMGGGREGGTCQVLRPCQPPQKKNFETCTSTYRIKFQLGNQVREKIKISQIQPRFVLKLSTHLRKFSMTCT